MKIPDGLPEARPIELGPLTLLARIGQGGMAEVWKAHHEASKTPLAVKIITSRRSARFMRWFKAEIQASARLDHVSIVPLLDVGQLPSRPLPGTNLPPGSPFLLMDYITGGTLVPCCGNVSWPRARQILLILLDALAHAHARGVVHRDLKPSNVLLGERDEDVYLSDFGLAQVLDKVEGGEQESGVIGTPGFMAPEQFGGGWRAIGPQADLYALGCVAYGLLFGDPPFGQGGSFRKLMLAHWRQPPPGIPSQPGLPESFEPWVRRLLEKNPRRRFATAADAAFALRDIPTYLEGDPGGVASQDVVPGVDGPTTGPYQNERTLSIPSDRLPVVFTPAQTLVCEADLESMRPIPVKDCAHAAPPMPEDWRHQTRAARRRLYGGGLGLRTLRMLTTVGREPERDALWRALYEVGESGEPRMVCVEGGAGCGKSHLARWLCTRAVEVGAATRLIATHSALGGPDTGLAGMFNRHFRCAELSRDSLVERLRNELKALGAEDAVEWWGMAEIIVPSPETDKRRVRFTSSHERHALMQGILERLCRWRPVILWLDDLQWGQETLEFVEHLMTSPEKLPILIVGTLRSDVLAQGTIESRLVARLASLPASESHELGPLTDAQQAALVQELADLEPRLVAEVTNMALGNPLFAVHLVDNWIARGSLKLGPKGLHLARRTSGSLPANLHALWIARLEEALHDTRQDDRIALELAAALGQHIHEPEWRALCEHARIEPAPDLVERMVEQRLIVRNAPEEALAWSFVHGMLRDTLELLAEEKGRLKWAHRLCADVVGLQDGFGVSERIGRHLALCGEHELATRQLLKGARERGRAGSGQVALALVEEREQLLTEASIDADDPSWGMGWVERSLSHFRLGEFGEARRWARRIAEGERGEPWLLPMAWAYAILGAIDMESGHLKLAERRLTTARGWGAAFGDSHLLGTCDECLGWVHMRQGRLETAYTFVTQARGQFESVDPVAALGCVVKIGYLASRTGRAEQGLTMLLSALDKMRDMGIRGRLVADCYNSLGEVARSMGRLQEAEAYFRGAIAEVEIMGEGAFVYPWCNLGQTLIELGRTREAHDFLSKAMVTIRDLKRRDLEGVVRVCMLPCLAVESDWEGWRREMPLARAQLQQTGVVFSDTASMAERAGHEALVRSQPHLARSAWMLARDQWDALGDDEKVDTVDEWLESLDE